MAGDKRYGTIQWKRLRLAVLYRDGYVCQVGGPKCVGRASTVDHITPVILGGAFWDQANLRASCKPCNYASGTHIRDTVTDVVAQLHKAIAELEAENAHLRQELAKHDSGRTQEPVERTRPHPAIY